MNAIFTPYDGPRATSYTLASQSTPVAVQAGQRSTLQVLQVHLGMRGVPGAYGAPVSINFSFGDAARVIAPALVGQIVLAVNINVATPFNGVGASLSIGTLAVPDLLVAPTQLDLSVPTEFEINPNVKFNSPTDIYLTITPGAGATQGAGWLVLETAIFN